MEINWKVNIPKLNLMLLMINHMIDIEINQMEQTKKLTISPGEEIYDKNSNKLEKDQLSIELFCNKGRNSMEFIKKF